MLRLLCALTLAMAMFVLPASIAPQSSGQAQAEPAAKKDDGKEATKKEKKEKKKATKKKERTEKQKAASERMKKCGGEYQEAKKSGKLAKGTTWAKFRSECLARLKKA